VGEHVQRGIDVLVRVQRQMPGLDILGVSHVGKLIRRQRLAVYCLRECIAMHPTYKETKPLGEREETAAITAILTKM
jgi:hypothetical protein